MANGGAAPRRFSINSLVGKIEMNAKRLIMTNGVTIMPMPAGYMFQRSEICRYNDPQKGQHNGVISNPAPGAFINAVSRPGPALTMIASPDFAPSPAALVSGGSDNRHDEPVRADERICSLQIEIQRLVYDCRSKFVSATTL